MSQRRKVYIASRLTQEAIGDAFNFLDDRYERVVDPSQSDVIIYDLSNKATNWPLFLGAEVHNVPAVFVGFGKEDPENWEVIRQCLPFEPPLHKTPDELLNKLREILYTVGRAKTTEINKKILDLILADQRGAA